MHRAFLAALAALSLFPAIPVHGGEMVLAGSSTVAQEIVAPIAEPFKNATGTTLAIQVVGSGDGMLALLQGKARAAMVSESLEDVLFAARQLAGGKGMEIAVPPDLAMTQLGRGRLVVIVHRDNPLVALNRPQIKDIFTGKVANWKDLGGGGQPIVPIVGKAGSGIRSAIQRKVMDDEDYVKGIRETRLDSEIIPMVAKNKGAIAVVSLSGWSAQGGNATRIVATPDYSHPLGLVTIGKPDADIRRLIGFIRANSRI